MVRYEFWLRLAFYHCEQREATFPWFPLIYRTYYRYIHKSAPTLHQCWGAFYFNKLVGKVKVASRCSQ